MSSLDAELTARSIRALLQHGDVSTAFRMLMIYNNNLVAEVGWNRLRLVLPSPATTGSPAWDAAIAGITEYRLNQVPMPSPEWVHTPRLAEPTAIGSTSDKLIEPGGVPAELLKRNILIETTALEGDDRGSGQRAEL